MKLNEFEKVVKGLYARYESNVPNNRDYKLVVIGPSKAIKETLNESDIEITINSNRTMEDWEDKTKIAQDKDKIRSESITLEGLDDLFKIAPPKPTKKNSIIVSLEGTKNDGTLFRVDIRNIAIIEKALTFFRLPPVFRCIGTVSPSIGDTDLFLRLNSPLGPLVDSSSRPGTLVDIVSHSTISVVRLFHFVPLFFTFGFTESTFDLTMVGED